MDVLFHQPYRMIVVGLVSSIALGIFLLIYHYIYPKKKIRLLTLLILISLLPLISILRQGSYESGDLSLHAKYAMGFYNNLTEGNIIPQWMGNDCTLYGCPEFIFIYPLPYYLISLFHTIGFSFLFSVKTLLITSFIASGVGMYLWIKNELGRISGFVSSIFYLFAPYHLIDLHFRVSIGELVSFAVLPFLFLFSKKFIETKKIIFFFLSAVFLVALILSHHATAFASSPLLISYEFLVWWRKKDRKYSTFLYLIGSYILGGLLTTFYWLPLLSESKYIWYSVDQYIGFHDLSSFLYTPNRFFLLFQGHMGELYTSIGYTQIFVVLFSVFLLYRKKIDAKSRILLILSLIGFILLFLLMQSFTKPLWDFFSFTKSVQFSWRLMIEVSLIVSVIAGIVVKSVKSNRIVIILCIVTILYTVLNWGNRKTIPTITDTVLQSQPIYKEKPGGVELTTPKWVDRDAKWMGVYPREPIEALSGEASFKTISRNITYHSYQAVVKKDTVIKESTYYFPGWKLFINGHEHQIDFNNKQYKGAVTFNLPKGSYSIVLRFISTPITVLAQKISLISLGALLLIIYMGVRSNILKRK